MRRGVSLLALGAALAGCSDPYAHEAQRGGPPVPRSTVAGSATTAARVFAERWANWDWRTATTQQRTLAELATGRLATDLRANAISARIDASLARDKPSVRGIVAIVKLAARGSRAAGLVVTREQRYTAGRPDLGGKHYRVYAITLARRGARWEVSAWQPQP